MSVNWKALLKNQAVGLEDLPTAREIVGGMPETVTIAAKSEGTGESLDPANTVETVNAGTRIAIALALLLICVIAGMGVVASRRGAH